MNIMFLTDNFPPEGNAIASRVYERACYWVKWGHTVTIITSVPNFPEGKIFPGYQNKFYQVNYMDKIRVVRVKTFIAKNSGFLLRTLDFLSYIFPALIAGLFQNKPDVIISTTPQFFVGITGWLLSRLRRVPFILEVADLWPASIVGVGAMEKSLLIKMLEKIELFLYRQASSVVVLTESFKINLIARGTKADKIFVVINGVDTKKYIPVEKDLTLANDLNINKNQLVVGYIGTHGMAHGLNNVLRSAKLLISNPNILFLFVGAGAERNALIKYADNHQITNVKFHPAQPKNSITKFWGLCDIALVHLKMDPVFKEVIPSKIFEAMGMHLPILLAAPEGEASNIILRENVGTWVQAGDPGALANAVHNYYVNQELRFQHAKKSGEAAPFYSREKQAQSFLNIMATTVKNVE